jgi:hypothetical protein
MLASDREETSERASSHRARPTPVVMEQKPARERASGCGGLATYRMQPGALMLLLLSVESTAIAHGPAALSGPERVQRQRQGRESRDESQSAPDCSACC